MLKNTYLHPWSSGSIIQATVRDVLFVVLVAVGVVFFQHYLAFHELSWASTVIRVRLASQFLVHGRRHEHTCKSSAIFLH